MDWLLPFITARAVLIYLIRTTRAGLYPSEWGGKLESFRHRGRMGRIHNLIDCEVALNAHYYDSDNPRGGVIASWR